jgi:uncharacterized protein (DUF488 family)
MARERSVMFTIGHSTRPEGEFWEILQGYGIRVLADIRRFPGSRRYPHFSKDALAAAAPAYGLRYVWLPLLGGRRKADPNSRNRAWRNLQFRAYADYMETTEFQTALDELCAVAREAPTAVMCSEAVWWRCHRSLIADFLKAKGWQVCHIFSAEKVEEHPFTAPAKVENGRLSYRL